MPREEGLCRWRRKQGRAARPPLLVLRVEGSWMVSDLGKAVFPEDEPGSGVSGGQAREEVK